MTQTRPFLEAACLCLSQSFPHLFPPGASPLHPFPLASLRPQPTLKTPLKPVSPNPCSLVSVSSWPCFSISSSAPIPSVLCILSPILGILLVSLSARCLSIRSVLGPHPLPSLCPLSPPYLFCLLSSPVPLPWGPILSPLCIFPPPLSVPSRAQAGWGRGGEVAPRAAPPPPPPRRSAHLRRAPQTRRWPPPRP